MTPWVLIVFFYYVAPPGPVGAATQIEMPDKAACYKTMHDLLDVLHHDQEMTSARVYCVRRDGKNLTDP